MSKKNENLHLPFGKKNYLFLSIGIALLALGYVSMSFEDFIDARDFSIALYVSPLIILAGFIVVGYSILAKDKDSQQQDASQEG